MLPDMLRRDRERWGMSVGEAGWRLGITRREYVAIEDGEEMPNADEYEGSASSSGGRTRGVRTPSGSKRGGGEACPDDDGVSVQVRLCAGRGDRTLTSVSSRVFETRASADSAIPARGP